MANLDMNPRTIDAYMQELLDAAGIATPEEGESVSGYRLFYEYKDKLYPPIVGSPRSPKTGIKNYAPITYLHDHPGTQIQGKEFVHGFSKGIPYSEDYEGFVGYYYWPTKELAQAFYQQMEEAFGGEQHEYVVINNNTGKITGTHPILAHSENYHTEKTEGFGKLVIYPVYGTASKNVRGDGGFVMSDFMIPPGAKAVPPIDN